MADKQVILAIFGDEAAADAAVVALKDWDKLDDDVKLNAIGVLVVDEKGKIKQHKLGRHNTGKGAGIGFVLGIIGVALGPVLGLGILGWTVIGAVAGRLVKKSLGLTKEDLERLGGELKGGKAAVGVMVRDEQVGAVSAKLTELGGVAEAHPVEEDELTEAASADAEAEVAAGAADEAAAEAPAAEA